MKEISLNNIDLYGKEYWQEKRPVEWNCTNYFLSILKKNPSIDRQTANYYLREDLETLLFLYIDNSEAKKIISKLIQTVKKPSTSTKASISQFWAEYANNYRRNTMHEKSIEEAIKISLKEVFATEIINENNKRIKALTSSPSTAASSESIRTRSEKRRTFDSGLSEYDDVRLTNNDLSVGTIIKRAALQIHSEMIEGKSLTSIQRKIMTNGLSSILDLSDKSFPSQRSLFSEDEWKELNSFFSYKLPLVPHSISTKISDVLTIISATIGLSGDYNCCKKLIIKEIELSKSTETTIGLEVIMQILRIMENYQYMLTKSQSKKATEDDYLRCIWSPLFEAIFPPKDNKIRIKSGESMNPTSSSNKIAQYNTSKYVKSLKVDFRLLIDLNNGDEVDVAAGECALHDNDDKAIADEGKLAREVKDALDNIVMTVPEDLNNNTCWSIQTTGAHCTLCTIDLEANGLYVSMHRHSFNIPFNHSGLADFSSTISWLLTIRKQLLGLDGLIKKHNNGSHSNDKSFNRKGKVATNNKAAFIRDSYYTPPRNTPSKIPLFLFQSAPTDLTEKNITESAEDTIVTEPLSFLNSPDQYGYRSLTNGKVYNVFTKKGYDHHPFRDSSNNDDEKN